MKLSSIAVLILLPFNLLEAVEAQYQFNYLKQTSAYAVKDRDVLYLIQINSIVRDQNEVTVTWRVFSEGRLSDVNHITDEWLAHQTHFSPRLDLKAGFIFFSISDPKRKQIHRATPVNLFSMSFWGQFSLDYISSLGTDITSIDENILRDAVTFNSSGFHRLNRLWQAKDGRFLEGRFIRQDDTTVQIENLSGRHRWKIPKDQLSEADLAFLALLRMHPEYDPRDRLYFDQEKQRLIDPSLDRSYEMFR